MITRQAAIELCVELWPLFEKHKWHIGLTGSCLYKGYSEKDIDLIAYPHTWAQELPTESLLTILEDIGFTVIRRANPADGDSTETVVNKIFVTTFRDLRIDIFNPTQ
jgi:predicted nucleotidyltransferase